MNELKKNQSDIKITLTNQEIYNRELLKEIVYKMAVTKKWDKIDMSKMLEAKSNFESIQSHLRSVSLQEAPSPNSVIV